MLRMHETSKMMTKPNQKVSDEEIIASAGMGFEVKDPTQEEKPKRKGTLYIGEGLHAFSRTLLTQLSQSVVDMPRITIKSLLRMKENLEHVYMHTTRDGRSIDVQTFVDDIFQSMGRGIEYGTFPAIKQVRFPTSKKKRIRAKWKKDVKRNYVDDVYLIVRMGDRHYPYYILHPRFVEELKKEMGAMLIFDDGIDGRPSTIKSSVFIGERPPLETLAIREYKMPEGDTHVFRKNAHHDNEPWRHRSKKERFR